jgi:tetratricopeptide (TPR) repeat protein
MTLAPNPAQLVLQKLSDVVRLGVHSTPRDSHRPVAFLANHPRLLSLHLRRAARQAWLALEVALAGPALWRQLRDGAVFRQQMEALLDLLSLAGLEADDLDVRRDCREELRGARRAGILPLDAPAEDDSEFRNGTEAHEPSETGENALEDLKWLFQGRGYRRLALLVGLRSPWGDPLFIDIVDYFLHRSLRADATPEQECDLAGEPAGVCGRCLEVIAALLDEDETAVEELLDGDDSEAAAASVPDAEAVEKLFQLGLSRHLNGDYLQAVAHFTAALRLAPTEARLYAHRGDAYRLQCEYERAIADFHIALRLDPSQPATLVSRAIALHLSGEHKQAVADCTAAIDLDSTSATAYRTRAAAHAALKSQPEALADLSRAAELAPQDGESHYQRGLLYAELREYDQAIADFTHLLNQNPHYVLAWLQRGHVYRGAGDYPSAIRDYTEVLRLHPTNVLAYSNRGLAHKLHGDTDRAIADYTEALRLEPRNARVRYSRAVIYRYRGDLASAQADLEESLRHEPQNWAALYHRGKVFLARGYLSQALQDMTAALTRNPHLTVAHVSRALILDRVGRYQPALADSSRAIELDAALAVARLVRGLVHSHMGTRAAAIADLTEAIRLDARLTPAYQERALLLALQGEHDRALVDCNQFLILQPGDAAGYTLRSVVYQLKGQSEQAAADAQRALRIDPLCILNGFAPSLADRARAAALQRIADWIDGIKPPLPQREAPVIEPRAAPPAPRRPAPKTAEIPVAELKISTPIALEQEKPPATAPAERPAPVRQKPAQREPEPTPAPTVPAAASVETAPEVAVTAEKAIPPAVAAEKTASTAAEEEEAAAETLLSDPPLQLLDSDDDEGDEFTLADDVQVGPRRAMPAKEDSPPVPRRRLSPRLPDRVWCPHCSAAVVPGDTFDSGRVRCSNCNKKIVPAAPPPERVDAAPLPRPFPTRRAAVEDDDDETFAERWGKTGLILGGLAVVVAVVLYYYLPWEKWARPSLYPAHGLALFEGKPMPAATVVLQPTWLKEELTFPRPHATVQDDGTFVVGTFDNDDGAPAGEYQVMVTWFVKDPKGAVDDDGMPIRSSPLPRRYATFENSGLTVRIGAGENEIPTLQLKR